MNRTLIRTAMITAAVMLAHQVAAKAFRDSAFLTAWPATALPLMSVATAGLTVTLAPIVSRLFERYSPLRVVAIGFVLSAAGHAIEWLVFTGGREITVVIYLHLAGAGAVLLSGFWSVVADRFDPAAARVSYGRIAAAGTVGGVLGGLGARQLATTFPPETLLLILSALHVLCAAGVTMMRHAPALLPLASTEDAPVSGLRETMRSPYLRTIAAFVILSSAAAAILDFIMKSNARAQFAGPDLLRFFATYYALVQLLSFVAQTRAGTIVQRVGIGRTMSALPGAVGTASLVALLLQTWPAFVMMRGVEAVLRNSMFRSGYELLFIPMNASTRHRVKTTLDVVGDRAGEAAGSALVQLLLLTTMAASTGNLLVVVTVLAATALWLGHRLGSLYVGTVESELLRYGDAPQLSFASEAGWTLVQAPPTPSTTARPSAPPPTDSTPAPARLSPRLDTLVQLQSGDAERVTSVLTDRSRIERIHVAAIIDLLAWDHVLPAARTALEELAPAHLGLLSDAMLDPSTDFTIRRRLPRILGTVASRRSIDGLLAGLDDQRFEVRYHCSRAINRLLATNPELSPDPSRVIGIVERELSVPPQKWRGYQLLDRPEADDAFLQAEHARGDSTFTEYVVRLLSIIVAREPLGAAVHGIRSANPGVRGLAIEYLDQVLPPAVSAKLTALVAAMSSEGAEIAEKGSQRSS
jgi:ATP:ADP antiporter, AAA family